MKKVPTKASRQDDDDMRTEYDFTGGTRGKHCRALQAGYTVTIRGADGTTEVREVKPREGVIVLASDVRDYFPDSQSVNAALRSLIRLIPRKRRPARKKEQGTEAE